MKKWYTSKTVWFNLLMAALAAAEVSWGMLQPVLPANVYQVLLFTLTVGNVVLRFLTTQGVGK